MTLHERHRHQDDQQRRAGVGASAVGLGGGLLLSVGLAAAPATALDRAPEPQLSISVDNGRTSAEVGDTLDYTITVENIGTDAVRGLRVTQALPEGLSFESADRGGAVRNGMVVWSVDLAPQRDRTLHATMTLGATPDEVLRMAPVVCASLSLERAPLVCATHSDELPAGSAARERDEAEAAAEDAAGPAPSAGGDVPDAGVLGGAAALGVLLTVLGLRRRRTVAARASSVQPG